MCAVCAGAARLPGFHTCVGGGGERQEAAWYDAKGTAHKYSTSLVQLPLVYESSGSPGSYTTPLEVQEYDRQDLTAHQYPSLVYSHPTSPTGRSTSALGCAPLPCCVCTGITCLISSKVSSVMCQPRASHTPSPADARPSPGREGGGRWHMPC